MQYEKNPKTGEDLHFSEDNIIKGLSHKSIKQWAYIKHDKDVYSSKDEEDDDDGIIKAGDKKPIHWHIVGRADRAIELPVLAKWFGIPEQYIDIPKGRGAFLDCVQYLTHEKENQQEMGKVYYSDENVKSNFNFREALDKRAERLLKYGVDLDPRTAMRYDVRFDGKTLRQCKEEDQLLYLDLEADLKKQRLNYIESELDVPKRRLNFYISGDAGYGKDAASKALARSLYPNLKNDDEIFFEVGGDNVTFEGYDGQPVIIWSERRANTLLSDFKGRENLFKVFDPHPHNGKLNIKYGSIKLVNTINIVNSVQDYNEFLKGLAGEYKDKNGNEYKAEDVNQSYRRFPFIIPLRLEDFDILLNRYCFGKSDNPQDYEVYKSVVGNFGEVRSVCKNNEKLARKYENILLDGIDKPVNEFLENNQELTEEQIEARFKDFGKTKQQVEEEKKREKLGLFALCEDEKQEH